MATKVFVGNLSFKTKEAELADEFRSAGKVVTANIITRGYRSLGYGFVEFESNEEAQNALSTLNKRSINGREINVELATPREEGAPRPPRQPRRGGGLRGGRGGYPPREQTGEGSPNPENRQENFRGGRGGYRGGRGGFRRPNSNPASPNVDHPNNDNGDQSPQTRPPRGRGGYRGRGGPRKNVNPRSPPQNVNRVPSTTTLFVANLPYALSDDELLTLLPKASKAYVAKNYNGRSKGFGFIEFANEDDQKAALASSEKLLAQGRELIVKIALTESKKPENISAPSDAQPAQ
eukprot:TRINITY_DN17795_c0_g1_i1.p1 TRINITY_DN17795_c0_g1~~TRINITY_DN17795_c0_g1_i1.p1  ORF type:complete len:292 (+),score=78.61 TRINITY_DN17795_c0_g1_i1:119-994(+)